MIPCQGWTGTGIAGPGHYTIAWAVQQRPCVPDTVALPVAASATCAIRLDIRIALPTVGYQNHLLGCPTRRAEALYNLYNIPSWCTNKSPSLKMDVTKHCTPQPGTTRLSLLSLRGSSIAGLNCVPVHWCSTVHVPCAGVELCAHCGTVLCQSNPLSSDQLCMSDV